MEKTDEELIVDYTNGDTEAFSNLTHRHLRGVYSFVLRFVGNQHEAEDIAQETFVKAWKNIGQYRSETSKFKTWLLRIARNSAVDYLRKKKNIPFSSFENSEGQNVLEETLADPAPLADALASKHYDSAELQQAINLLAPDIREILLFHYTNGLTFQEIGEMLGQPQNTIKSRHYRAIQLLRRALANTELSTNL